MTFYYTVKSSGYIEAENRVEAAEILEEMKVWELDNIEMRVKLDNDYWEKDSDSSLGLKQSDFI